VKGSQDNSHFGTQHTHNTHTHTYTCFSQRHQPTLILTLNNFCTHFSDVRLTGLQPQSACHDETAVSTTHNHTHKHVYSHITAHTARSVTHKYAVSKAHQHSALWLHPGVHFPLHPLPDGPLNPCLAIAMLQHHRYQHDSSTACLDIIVSSDKLRRRQQLCNESATPTYTKTRSVIHTRTYARNTLPSCGVWRPFPSPTQLEVHKHCPQTYPHRHICGTLRTHLIQAPRTNTHTHIHKHTHTHIHTHTHTCTHRRHRRQSPTVARHPTR
jgi:hypothetical protein